jgi:hypothetical protein
MCDGVFCGARDGRKEMRFQRMVLGFGVDDVMGCRGITPNRMESRGGSRPAYMWMEKRRKEGGIDLRWVISV